MSADRFSGAVGSEGKIGNFIKGLSNKLFGSGKPENVQGETIDIPARVVTEGAVPTTDKKKGVMDKIKGFFGGGKAGEQEKPADEKAKAKKELIEKIGSANDIDGVKEILTSILGLKIIKEDSEKDLNKMMEYLESGEYDQVKTYFNEQRAFIEKSSFSKENKAVLDKFYAKAIEIADRMEGVGDDGLEVGEPVRKDIPRRGRRPSKEDLEPKVSRNEKSEPKKERENEGILDKYNLSDAYEIVKKMDENEIKKEWRAHPKLKIETSNKPVVIDEEVIKDYNELVAQYAIKENKEVPFFFVEDAENKRIVKIFIGEAKSYGSAELSPLTAKAKNGETFAAWWNGENKNKNLFNGKNGKFKVGMGHTHPKGYGPIFSNVGGGDFGLDYSSEFEFRSSALFAVNSCASNISFVGSPDTGLISATEVKKDGVIVFNPISVLAEKKAKEEKKEKGVKTKVDFFGSGSGKEGKEQKIDENEVEPVKIDEQTKEGIKKGLEKIKKNDEEAFWKIGGLANSFSKDERLFGDVFTKEWFDNYMKDIGIKYEEIEGIKTKDFMAVVKVAYEEVKGEKKDKKDQDKKPPDEPMIVGGGGSKKGKEKENDGWNERRENLIENVKKYISKNLNQDEKKFFFEIAESEFEYRPFAIFIEDMIKDKKMDKLSELRKYYKDTDDLKLSVGDMINKKTKNIKKKEEQSASRPKVTV